MYSPQSQWIANMQQMSTQGNQRRNMMSQGNMWMPGMQVQVAPQFPYVINRPPSGYMPAGPYAFNPSLYQPSIYDQMIASGQYHLINNHLPQTMPPRHFNNERDIFQGHDLMYSSSSPSLRILSPTVAPLPKTSSEKSNSALKEEEEEDQKTIQIKNDEKDKEKNEIENVVVKQKIQKELNSDMVDEKKEIILESSQEQGSLAFVTVIRKKSNKNKQQ